MIIMIKKKTHIYNDSQIEQSKLTKIDTNVERKISSVDKHFTYTY